MDLLLLGTKGGPRISAAGPGPSQLLEHDGRRLLVDAGEGVVHQLVRAGIDPATVCDVLITHHHCDHNVALGNVLMANWVQGGDRPIRVYGPPPLREIVGHLLAAHSYDIALRVADEGRVDLRELVEVVELDGSDAPFAVGGVRVSATAVEHAPVEPALAYRFDAGGASVVISGDTAPSDALVQLATGADLLVHEVIHPGHITEQHTNASWPQLRRHLLESHTSIADVGDIARRAGVRTLVLSHLVPAGLTEEQWRSGAGPSDGFDLVVGADLMRFSLTPTTEGS